MPSRRALWSFSILAAEVLLFFRKVLFSHYLIPWDLQYYHQPLAWFASRSLAHGELPLWDPYSYCGMPVYANLTLQLFYPPATLMYLVSNWWGDGRHLVYLLELSVVAHVLLGGMLTWWLLRRLGAATAPALIAATVFQLGAYFATQTQHVGAIESAAWMPLAWLAVFELAQGLRWRWLVGLAAALAMSLLAGFPAVAAVVYGSTLLLAALLVTARKARWTTIAWCAVACAGSLAVSAVQLIPTMELSALSVAALRAQWMGTGGGVPLGALATLVMPDHFGVFQFGEGPWKQPWNLTFLYLYCGVPALLLGGFALVRRRAGLEWIFGAMALAGALWMLGDSTPVYRALFWLLPARLKSALYAEFAMCAFTLALAVLAGLGAQEWLRSRNRAWKAALVAVTALDLIAVSSGRPMNTIDEAREPGVGHDHYDRIQGLPERMRQLVGEATPPWRVDTMAGSLLWSSSANLFEVPTANGDDPFALARYMLVRESFTGGEPWGRYYEVRDPDSPILKLLNVRYVLSNGRLAQPGALTQRLDLPGTMVYENANPLPRFFLVGRVQRARDRDEAVRILRRREFDPRSEAVIEGADVTPGGSGSVSTLRYSAREVEIESESATASFLVTSEAWYPGWQASVDGHAAPLVLTNAAFRGLSVPAGRHRVRMRFDPPVLWRSAWVSILALALAMAALAMRDNGRSGVRWIS